MKKIAIQLLKVLKIPALWLGVDYQQFETLLLTKLKMDFRNSPTGFQSMGSTRKNTITNQLIAFGIFGGLFGMASLSLGDLSLGLTIFFSIILVFLTMTLVSEFTTVLFDHRDNYILLPRPVSNRTLLFYRLVHIQFYMGLLTLALALPLAIMISYKYSVVVAVIFMISVGICTWISLMLTTFVYLMLSKVVNGEKFKDIISYAQIVMAIVVFGSYQLVPHMINIENLRTAVLQVSWWTYFFPPAWLAAFVKICCFNDRSVPFLILGSTGVLIPLTGVIILMRYLSAGFGNILSENTAGKTELKKNTTLKTRISTELSNIFCISDYERAGWDMTLATIKRDRKFKQTVYPNFGIMIVVGIVILRPDLTNLVASLQGNDDFRKYFFIMMMGFSVVNAIFQLAYTDTPEAGWIYRALPLSSQSHLLTGSIKAVLSKFLAPIYAFLLIPSLILWGIPFLFQIILSFLATIFLVQMTIIFQESFLPFTRIREMQQKGLNSLMAILNMILMSIAGGLIYLTKYIPLWITAMICCLSVYCIILIFRHIRKSKFKFA